MNQKAPAVVQRFGDIEKRITQTLSFPFAGHTTVIDRRTRPSRA
jgi:hypothetical protein